jgi:hypothetical protein
VHHRFTAKLHRRFTAKLHHGFAAKVHHPTDDRSSVFVPPSGVLRAGVRDVTPAKEAQLTHSWRVAPPVD